MSTTRGPGASRRAGPSADEGGATAIEYALIAGCVAMAVVAAVGALGDKLAAVFSGFANVF